MRTMWKEEFCELFTTTNGIRQGDMISPVLFCIYMDALLNRLEREGYGCLIGNHYFELLSPSVHGHRKLTEVCVEFGEEYGVQYNPTKIVCILYCKKDIGEKPRIELCGTALQWVDMVKDLGNYLDANMKEETEIQRKKGDLIQRVNNMLVSIGKSSDAVVRNAYNTQCAHLYGAAAWNFRDKAVS